MKQTMNKDREERIVIAEGIGDELWREILVLLDNQESVPLSIRVGEERVEFDLVGAKGEKYCVGRIKRENVPKLITEQSGFDNLVVNDEAYFALVFRQDGALEWHNWDDEEIAAVLSDHAS